jgi:hypothetical protein
MNGPVWSLAVHNGLLIVGGDFTEAGGQPAEHIAVWTGISWSPLGSGLHQTDPELEASVAAVASHDGALFVGGSFEIAGQGTSLNIARWGQPTPVMLSGFVAERHHTAGVVRWQVASQTQHAGFHVYREVAGGQRERLTDVLLAGRRSYEFVDHAAPRGETLYWLQALDTGGGDSWHGPVTLPALSGAPLRLARSWPNPFNPQTTLSYVLPSEGPVELALFDAAGRRVATLVDRVRPAGEHTAVWDGTRDDGGDAASGLYVARLTFEGEVRTLKIVLAR